MIGSQGVRAAPGPVVAIPAAATFAIAVDGPAGAGKSVLGAALAGEVGATYVDSGLAYRAVTWDALERGLDLDDDASLAARAGELEISIVPPTVRDGRQFTVTVGGRDVTWKIRAPEVDAAVSRPSALPGVRDAVTRQLRRLGATGRVVMVGRDIGTVVLPDATLKLWVTASAGTRARRRVADLQARGLPAVEAEVLAAIVDRDARDSSRLTAPSRAAPDAIVIATDSLTVEEEVAVAVAALAPRLCLAPTGGAQ